MLELVGLAKSFGRVRVFESLYASLAPGTVYALIGPNGSGKSTLLKALWGELGLDAGGIAWGGSGVDTSSEDWKRLVGAVPDDDALIDGLSIRGHFRLCGSLSGLSKAEVETRADALMALFGLGEAARATRMASEASRGNRKRLACALALLGEPSIILMDEPFSGLDAERAAELTDLLRLLAARGRLVVFSCHEEGITRSAADRYLLLRDGGLRAGPVDELPELRRSDTALGHEALPWIA